MRDWIDRQKASRGFSSSASVASARDLLGEWPLFFRLLSAKLLVKTPNNTSCKVAEPSGCNRPLVPRVGTTHSRYSPQGYTDGKGQHIAPLAYCVLWVETGTPWLTTENEQNRLPGRSTYPGFGSGF